MIYCDYQATTPLAPEAREAMLRWLSGPEDMGFANPHSPHRAGRQAAAAVDIARERVARLFPAGGQIIFTSGATEAINLAMRGFHALQGDRRMAVSAIEHAAVLETAHALDSGAVELPVSDEGLVDPNCALPENCGLCAVMQVNNEIGTIQPVEELAQRAHASGALFLCDAVQGAGKIAPPQEADLIAVSAHKLYGPKGIGALWVRDGVELACVSTGGGQEAQLRSGTLSPALCAGFGVAAELAVERMEQDRADVEKIWLKAREMFADWTLNGAAEPRWHGNLNLRRDGLDVARLLSDARTIAFSAGSACASGSGRTSHVLRALGLSDAQAKNSIRLGFGRYTSMAELEEAAQIINDAAAKQG
ncbi:cysteine desulfurase family protein [Altericroceibacterium endophyticum]|uniref:Cysteine desulfurase n=1 Tax=Altericroceibacterium endophyticum TaxID=1808508 RepID=A0A6I4T3V9_9SPHN|nr:cysteine desulfurase family protein [Altericroceibacterium endophyticum]MXO64225.1 aminotransferase class V-fold PLP-dependent enzyme [Altericroceibacterium endophyticum]